MFTIYAKSGCRACGNAARFLTDRQIDFDYFILDRDYSIEDFMALFPRAKTFPHIIQEDDESAWVIGGYQDLKESFGE
jgi:glutaredoxin